MTSLSRDEKRRASRIASAKPTVRDERRLATRSRLLVAAEDVFCERGYATATIDDISARADTNRATFYLHFSGKAEIVEELSATWMRERFVAHSWWDDPPATWAELRARLVPGLAETFARPELPAAFLQAQALEPSVAAVWQRGLAARVLVLTPLIAHAAGIDEQSATVRAALLLIATDRLTFINLLPHETADLEAVVDSWADLWWGAFTPTAQSRANRIRTV